MTLLVFQQSWNFGSPQQSLLPWYFPDVFNKEKYLDMNMLNSVLYCRRYFCRGFGLLSTCFLTCPCAPEHSLSSLKFVSYFHGYFSSQVSVHSCCWFCCNSQDGAPTPLFLPRPHNTGKVLLSCSSSCLDTVAGHQCFPARRKKCGIKSPTPPLYAPWWSV